MATAGDLIKSSLRAIGAIASGETPSASEQADALDVLNDILEDWSNDGFMIFENKIEELTLASGTQSYSIGSGATFDTARPLLITQAKFKYAGSAIEYPIDLWTAGEWAKISNRDLQSAIPRGLYYNPTYPNGTIYIWPIPTAADTLILYSQKPLTAIATAATTLSLPPGYKKALRYNLAVELAPEYGKEVSVKLEQLAKDAKTAIQRKNTKEALMVSDAFGLNECCDFDITSGLPE